MIIRISRNRFVSNPDGPIFFLPLSFTYLGKGYLLPLIEKYRRTLTNKKRKRMKRDMIDFYLPQVYFYWDMNRFMSISKRYNLLISLGIGAIYSLFVIPEIFRQFDPPQTSFWIILFLSLIFLFSLPFVLLSHYYWKLRQKRLHKEFEGIVAAKKTQVPLSEVERFLIDLKLSSTEKG
jgi:hypothetical protein